MRVSRTLAERLAARRASAPSASVADVDPAAELAAAHAELARRRSFMDALLETIDVGIVSCDADGRFVVSNRAERALFELDDGLAGQPPEYLSTRIDVIDPDTGRRLAPDEYPLVRALRGEPLGVLDMIVGPVGGPHREIVVRARQITDPDGDVLGAVAALTDVTTERAAARAFAEEHQRLLEAQRLGQLGSFECDFTTGTSTFSDQMADLWGVSRDALATELVLGLVVEGDRELVARRWDHARRVGGRHSYECRIRRVSDGAERLLRCNLEVELGADGELSRCRGTQIDITELKAAEKVAQEATAFFDAVLTASPDYTLVVDVARGSVIYGSRGKDVLGTTSSVLQALGPAAIKRLVHPADERALRAVYASAARLGDGDVVQGRCRARHADGEWRWLNHRVTPFRRDGSGRVREVLAVVRDVTDVVEVEDRLRHAARHDTLTGLPNRALLMERLSAALTRSRREAREVAVLFCDLDGFKSVNDTGGHSAGDAVLLEVGRRLRSVLRADDTVARVGGDEFVLVVEPWNRRVRRAGSSPASGVPDRAFAEGVAARVVDALREPITVEGVDYLVTASIGITFADGDLTADEVLHAADVAMYRAKNRGKDRFEVSREVLVADVLPRQRA